MTPKQLLIDALRSGEFEQTRYCLKGLSGCCCVLGVMVELYIRHRTVEMKPLAQFPAPHGGSIRFSDGEDNYDGSLPKPVREWFGTDSCGSLRNPVPCQDGYTYNNLLHLNDMAYLKFNEIADVLETNEFTQALIGIPVTPEKT